MFEEKKAREDILELTITLKVVQRTEAGYKPYFNMVSFLIGNLCNCLGSTFNAPEP